MANASLWEYRRLLLKAPTDAQEHAEVDATSFFYFGRQEPDTVFWKDDEVAELGREGWELVAVVPIIGGRVRTAPSNNWSISYTIGYTLWFKRPQAL
jgi:hypothetical protein